MPPYHGQFNQKGLPVIEIDVIGESGSEKVFAVIDSGYNGYLSIPHSIAQSIGLAQLGVETASLANGDQVTYLECLGTVAVQDTRISAVIDVEEKGKVLLGNAFLKEARLCLRCDPHHSLVELNYQSKD